MVKKISEEFQNNEEYDMNEEESFTSDGQSIHSINPLGMRVLVEVMDISNKSKGGLYLPDNAKEQMAESILAKVVAVATAMDEDTDEETNISGIPYGALVLIENDIGIKVPWNDKLRIIETIDVLATVESNQLT